MGEYRFGLHSGEVSEYLFGVHYGHLAAPADQIAERHGAWHVNYTDPHGQRRGWFACSNRGAQFDQAIARAVRTIRLNPASSNQNSRRFTSDRSDPTRVTYPRNGPGGGPRG